ncbi:hypothetical protein [Microtetraspora sp. AC03309]|nr:hypothetical protein [Microtetraspora sp. AC03309]
MNSPTNFLVLRRFSHLPFPPGTRRSCASTVAGVVIVPGEVS